MQNTLPAPTATGSFVKTPFAHLLVYALERRLTGTFEFALADGSPVATLTVMGGCPAKVRTVEPIHFLGTVMAELGWITDEQLRQSLERMQESPRLQGEILLETGAVNQESLDAGLRSQVERKVEHLFALGADTTYTYFDNIDILARYGGTPTPIDPFPVLWRGVRAAPVWEHVDATLKRIGSALVRPSASAQLERFAFSPEENEVIELLRQKPSRVLEIGNTSAGASASQLIVYLLLIMKQVDLVEPKVAPPSSTAVARLQLQRQKPLVVEEQASVSPADDERASTPGMRAPLPSAFSSSPDVTAAAGSSPDIEHAALRAKIIQRAEQITAQDYFQMLSLDRDSAPEAAQKAFIALAKTWHPDRLPAALADVKDACSKVFSHLTEAHATLTDAEKRQDYMTLLKDGGATPDDQAKIQAILEAATEFQKAEILLKRNLSDPQAYEILKRCVTRDPGRAEYVATLTWVESQRPEWQPKEKTLEKIQLLDRCIQRNDQLERAYFYRAMLYKRIDDPARALRDFKRASELNPRNVDAAREVRLYKMRGHGSSPPAAAPTQQGGKPSQKPPPSPGGGLLGKLFKK